MLLAGRMLVGFNGQDPEDNLIRYAAMVARIDRPAVRQNGRPKSRQSSLLALAQTTPRGRWQSHQRLASNALTASGYPEIRFVSLLPHDDLTQPSTRAALAAKVQQHFGALPQFESVNVDLLKGRAIERLTTLAADFDTDLLLLDNAADSRRKCSRLAVEAQCPVWLVPPVWAPVLRRILVPIDFSARAATSLQTAVDLASRFRPAKCIALHVDRQVSSLGGDAVIPARQHELSEEFGVFLTAIDPRGVRIQPLFVKSHSLDHAIARTAEEHGIDLTVMICRRRSRLSSMIHPSLAEAAIDESHGPFLLLKSGEKPLGVREAIQKRWQNADLPQYS